ncbi:zinc finger protein 84-like [Homarus americanus]|uniref:zinc finger protein 84-like n=1 Tax=Homarus americanus TaxID=6706 RepID=UPI001C456A00|nr:zinc finger protein 84-like [Homarus americanus]
MRCSVMLCFGSPENILAMRQDNFWHGNQTLTIVHNLVRLNSDSQMAADRGMTASGNMLASSKKMPKIYRCIHCPFISTKRCNFVEHFRTHTGERPFSCPQCSYRTGVKSNLKRHYFSCGLLKFHGYCEGSNCDTVTLMIGFKCAVLLDSHMANEAGATGAGRNIFDHRKIPKRHNCPQCKFSSSNKTHFIEHYRTHTGEKPFSCSFCSYQTERPSLQVLWERGSVGREGSLEPSRGTQKLHHCPYCSYTTVYATNLKNHTLTHTNVKPYACPHCPYRCIQKGSLKVHLCIHTGEKPYSCPRCPYQSSSSSHLKRHIRTHLTKPDVIQREGEGPFAECTLQVDQQNESSTSLGGSNTLTNTTIHRCLYCPYTTPRRFLWTNHMRTHTGEKPFACAYCNYAGATKEYLKKHILTHTGEKPYPCPHCSYRASQSTTLYHHLRTHTGKKPHRCDYCRKGFSTKRLLDDHILRLHSQNTG